MFGLLLLAAHAANTTMIVCMGFILAATCHAGFCSLPRLWLSLLETDGLCSCLLVNAT